MKKQEQTRDSTARKPDHFEEVSEKMKKKFWIRQFFFFFYHAVRIALAIAIIVLISQTDLNRVKQNKQYWRVQQILQIWKKNVITDIITVSTYNCPEGYEPYTAAEWEGTFQGCLCQTRLNDYDYIHVIPGQCSFPLIAAGCTKINPKQRVKFAFWKTDKLICVKRIKKLNFYTNISNFLTQGNLQTCAQGQAYEFQSLKDQDCPITQISNSSRILQHQILNIDFSYNRETSYPIADIKMSQYEFCMEYNKSNISPNRFQNYDLQIIERSNCQDDHDPRVKQIDQITEKTLFQNNIRINNIILNELPIFPRPTDRFIYKLGTIEYPSWTNTCRQSEQFNLQKTKQIFQFNQSIQKSQTCKYLTIALVTLWCFVFSVLFIVKQILLIRSKYVNGVLYYRDSDIQAFNPNLLSNTKFSISGQIIFFLFLISLALAMLIQIGVEYMQVSKTQQWFRYSFGCMDKAQHFRDWIQRGYINDLQALIRKYLICILSGILIACLDFIFLVWRLHKGDLERQNIKQIFSASEQQQQKNSNENISQGNDQIVEDKELAHTENDQFKSRQKTMDIDINTVHQQQRTQKQSNIRMSGSKMKKIGAIHRRNTTIGNSLAVNQVHNPTQQSLAHMDDDLQFNQIRLQSPRKTKNNRVTNEKNKMKSRGRVLSLDMEQEF